MQESAHKVRKSASQVVLSRMKLTLHADRRTPHGASRSVHAMSAWSVKTRRAPSQHCRDVRVNGLNCDYAQNEYTPPLPALRLHLPHFYTDRHRSRLYTVRLDSFTPTNKVMACETNNGITFCRRQGPNPEPFVDRTFRGGTTSATDFQLSVLTNRHPEYVPRKQQFMDKWVKPTENGISVLRIFKIKVCYGVVICSAGRASLARMLRFRWPMSWLLERPSPAARGNPERLLLAIVAVVVTAGFVFVLAVFHRYNLVRGHRTGWL